ncbi:MAG: glutamine--fructose-6-phosphate transaminase (isomerizing), partial [Pseudomonadota bacterium]
MCGIVGAVAQRDVAPILLEGLKRLEYRGYDSAGLAVLNDNQCMTRHRTLGKVKELEDAYNENPLPGKIGIAHTRWATHGEPSVRNAHPHICKDHVGIVHNGIIENHEILRVSQTKAGHRFTSETDTEVIVHAIHDQLETGVDLLDAVRNTTRILDGAYALGVINREEPNRMIVARHGSPLVIGLGIGENFIASDVFALLPVTQKFIFLEEGDIAEISRLGIIIFDREGKRVERAIKESGISADSVERGEYRHYMLKEIFEQPRAVSDTLEGRISKNRVLPSSFGLGAEELLSSVEAVQIVACGTSYHAGLVARYWFESVTGLPCSVEVASEYRYRNHFVPANCLFVTISQSGETADTLAALKLAKKLGYASTLVICNVPESSLVRESDMVFLTHAGPEIGVASTKAFTTQLVALLFLVTVMGRYNGLDEEAEERRVEALRTLPGKIEAALQLDEKIKELAERFVDKQHALFLGRGDQYPVAMEGALKLKEISYIHAEAYPAGELKHGPLALIDDEMPVITVAPNNELLEKLKSNLEEVRARGGELYVFADDRLEIVEDK